MIPSLAMADDNSATGKSKSCFVIAPLKEGDSPTRKRSDQVLKHIIKPAVKECGYAEPVRADQISKPGMITAQVVQYLLDSDLVVADLTDHNPNVFYELAIRHAIRKPIVQLIHKGDTLPFDVNQVRTIQFDHQDLDKVEECRELLIKQIQAAERDPGDADNPISFAIKLDAMRVSDNPVAQSNALVLQQLRAIQDILAQQANQLAITNAAQDRLLESVKLNYSGTPFSSDYYSSKEARAKEARAEDLRRGIVDAQESLDKLQKDIQRSSARAAPKE